MPNPMISELEFDGVHIRPRWCGSASGRLRTVRPAQDAVDGEPLPHLAERFPNANVIELGIDTGASTAFLRLAMKPARLLAVDINKTPHPVLSAFLDDHDPAHSVTVAWDTNQADVARLADLVASVFGDEPLDLVIDDASHELEPTRASFDLLFPLLRPGGLFVIEDWTWQHQLEHALTEWVGDPESEQGQTRTAELLAQQPTTPDPTMSQLIMELAVVLRWAPRHHPRDDDALQLGRNRTRRCRTG